MALHDEYDIQVSAGAVSRRHALNLIPGTGLSISLADNSGNDRADLTITNTGSNPAIPLPSDLGMIAWSVDPFSISGSASLISGTLYVIAFWIRTVQTLSTLSILVTAGGSGLTSNQNFAGIYDSTGTLQAQSADQTSAWGTNGVKQMAMTTPYGSAPVGKYYAAFLASGTTPPTIRSGNSIAGVTYLSNAGLSGASLRSATNGAGLTSLPNSITPSSNVGTSSALLGVIVT